MKKIISACSALTICAGIACMAAGSVYGAPNELQNITREEAGATVNNNFYCYANFERLKEAELPYDEDYVLPDYDWTIDAIIEIIDGIIANKASYPYGSNEQKIADCYAQLLDTETMYNANADILLDIVNRIEGAKSIDELVRLSAELHFEYGVPTILPMRIDAGIFDSAHYHAAVAPMKMTVDPKDFFKIYGTAEKVQRTYRKVIEKLGGEDSTLRAKNATDMIMDIADHSKTDTEAFYAPEEYVNSSLSELRALFTADMSPYTDILEKHGETSVTISDIEGLKCIAGYLTEDNLQAWKDHMATMAFFDYAEFLPAEYLAPLSELKGSSGYVSEIEAKKRVENVMGKELDYLFASKYADEERIEAAREFTRSIIKAYEGVIEQTEGLDAAAMAGFKKKLENCEVNIDVPREPYIGKYDWKPAEKGGTLLENIIMKNRADAQEKLDMLGTYFDRTKYNVDSMHSYTFDNACYSEANYVTIPFATICDPFFSPDNSLAQNLGRLGFVIGHEISHAFDSTCVKFDADGNLRPDWIGPEYSERLEKKKADITALYDSQKLFGVYPVDGKLTLGENMADIASAQCMFSMLKTKEEKQEFMETYAGGWFIYKYDTAAFDQIKIDEHSPEEFRVNTVLSQMDDFYEVYGITEGDMYTAPADRRRVW